MLTGDIVANKGFKWINVKCAFDEVVRTGVLIGMFFLFCSQDEVSNDPRRLRAVLGLRRD